MLYRTSERNEDFLIYGHVKGCENWLSEGKSGVMLQSRLKIVIMGL